MGATSLETARTKKVTSRELALAVDRELAAAWFGTHPQLSVNDSTTLAECYQSYCHVLKKAMNCCPPLASLAMHGLAALSKARTQLRGAKLRERDAQCAECGRLDNMASTPYN